MRALCVDDSEPQPAPAMPRSSTLCSRCAPLVRGYDFALLEDGVMSIPFCVTDELPSCPVLASSASAGCRFCAVLAKRLQAMWRGKTSQSTIHIGTVEVKVQSRYDEDLDEYSNFFYLLSIQVEAKEEPGFTELLWEIFAEEGVLYAIPCYDLNGLRLLAEWAKAPPIRLSSGKRAQLGI